MNIISIIVALLIFTVLIVIHEFGHFLAARKCGVPVEEFAIGMGPAIYQKKGKRTDFSIRLFPIGGYCKMTGEEEKSPNPDAFCNKNVWQKILIVVAGATFNIIFAVIILMIISNFTMAPTRNVETVAENSPAFEAGIEEGDIILGTNGKEYGIMDQVIFNLTVSKNDEDTIDLLVLRDGDKLNIPVNYKPVLLINETKDYVSERLVNDVLIESLNGESIKNIKNIKEFVNKTKIDYPASEENYKDNFNVYDVKAKLYGTEEAIQLSNDEVEILKLNAANRTNFIGLSITYSSLNPIEAINYGLQKTVYYITSTYKSFALLISGTVSKDQIAGPVGIIKMFGDSYEKGIAVSFGSAIYNLLSMAAMISINLGVINLLPLPALDGGRFFILLIEVVRRKPMDLDKESIVHFVGFVLLMILMIIILFNDVINIFG